MVTHHQATHAVNDEDDLCLRILRVPAPQTQSFFQHTIQLAGDGAVVSSPVVGKFDQVGRLFGVQPLADHFEG